MKIKFLFILIIFSIIELKSQNTLDEQLQIDYWNYRERLRKYFVMIGDKPGQSIVADRIIVL